MEFVSLVSVAAADEEALRAGQRMELARIAAESVRGRGVDLAAIQAKRALVHEWIEKGGLRLAGPSAGSASVRSAGAWRGPACD